MLSAQGPRVGHGNLQPSNSCCCEDGCTHKLWIILKSGFTGVGSGFKPEKT